MTAPTAKPGADAGASPLASPVQAFEVWSSAYGTTPGKDDVTETYRFKRLVRSSGSAALDYVELEIASEKPLGNTKTPSNVPRPLQVRCPLPPTSDPDPDTDPPPADCIFYGEVGIAKADIAAEERRMVYARIEPWHFGEPLMGYTVSNGSEDRTIHADIEFNPEVDGLIIGNRSSSGGLISGTDTWKYWIDPETSRTANALTNVSGQTATSWTLADAVLSLCWLLNPDETHINNPHRTSVEKVTGESPPLRNIVLRRGRSLPELLDDLLLPFGYSWYLRTGTNDAGEAIRTIALFQRGEGFVQDVKLPGPDDEPTGDNFSVAAASISWNLAEVATVVEVHGALLECECTVELVRCWAEADDDLTAYDLAKSDVNSQYRSKEHVWRKWALNEAGDYNGTRTTVAPITDAFDVNDLLSLGDKNVFRRRRFYDCLTKDTTLTDTTRDGGRRPPLVEYYDPVEEKWRDVSGLVNGSFTVLQRECGILFNGDMPPTELIALGEDARIRVTATIRGDQRLTTRYERTDEAPTMNSIVLFIDAADRFRKSVRVLVGDYASRYTDGSFPIYDADIADDTAALEDFAFKLQAIEQTMKLGAEITLIGYQPQYEIGDVVEKIDGRNISLNATAKDVEEKRYLQIMGIEYTETATRLTLQPFVDYTPVLQQHEKDFKQRRAGYAG